MPDLRLDIIVVPTYNIFTLGIADASTYPTTPPSVTNPSIKIEVPTFGEVILPFSPNSLNIFNSTDLGITQTGDDLLPLPDGVYKFTYTVDPAYYNNVNKTIIRVDKLQEKFDEAFMRLDMMECDRAIKTQSKVELNTIYFFIQGSIAAANNCAIDKANKLYNQADKMLTYLTKNNCGCSGINYLINFP
jgi:hypothetical protein